MINIVRGTGTERILYCFRPWDEGVVASPARSGLSLELFSFARSVEAEAVEIAVEETFWAYL